MELTTALKALADDNRLLILRLLGRRDYCVRALARQLGISQAAVSQHLKVLRQAGLVWFPARSEAILPTIGQQERT